jgi:hemin uptake protein HemP
MTDGPKKPAPTEGGDASKRSPQIDSRKLFGPHRQLSIIHNSQQYTLRITSNDKLILTK